MLTNEFVKDLGEEFFRDIDFTCLTFLDEINKDEKHNLYSYLFTTFYNHELVYPSEVEKKMVEQKIWKEAYTLNKLYETTKFEYNPIWNKDGTITEERTIEGTDGRTITDEGNRKVKEGKVKDSSLTVDIDTTDGGSIQTTDTGTDNVTFSGNSSSTSSDYPMDADSEKARENIKSSNSGSNNETRNLAGSETRNLTGTEDRTDTGKVTEDNNVEETTGNTQTQTGTNNQTEKYERVEQGNIGVTTTQSMIREEREIILNMYPKIVSTISDFFYFAI